MQALASDTGSPHKAQPSSGTQPTTMVLSPKAISQLARQIALTIAAQMAPQLDQKHRLLQWS